MEIEIDELRRLRERYEGDELSTLISHLDFVVYTVERDSRIEAVKELLLQRPYVTVMNFRTDDEIVSVLENGSDEPALLIVEAATDDAGVNEMVRKFKPRIVSLGFAADEIETVARILRDRGAIILNGGIVERGSTRWFQIAQSPVTRDSYFYVERSGSERRFDFFPNATQIEVEKEIRDTLRKKTRLKAFASMVRLDHVAYRVHCDEFALVAEELMKYTPYRFEEAHEIEEHDAKTIVFRHGDKLPALVASYGRTSESVVEGYVREFGPRVHHMAYEVTDIFRVVSLQRKRGVTYTSDDVIGTTDEGIVQIFVSPSPFTHEITEYVQRFRGFTGFFSKRNVGTLMGSTRTYQ